MATVTEHYIDGRRRRADAHCEMFHQKFPVSGDCITSPFTYDELETLAAMREVKIQSRDLKQQIHVLERAIANRQADADNLLTALRLQLDQLQSRWSELKQERTVRATERMRLLGYEDYTA